MDDTTFCFACFASITLSSRAAMILANLPPSSRVTLWILRSFHLLKGLHQLKCLISQYSHWTWLLGAAGRLEKKPMQLPYVGAQKTPAEMHCIGTAYYIYAWYRPDRTRRWHCAHVDLGHSINVEKHWILVLEQNKHTPKLKLDNAQYCSHCNSFGTMYPHQKMLLHLRCGQT